MDIREEIRLEGKLEGIQQGIRKVALFVQPLEQGTEKRHKSLAPLTETGRLLPPVESY